MTSKRASMRMSPHQRHGKIPYRYSPNYYTWREATKTGRGVEEARYAHDRTLVSIRGPAYVAKNNDR